MKADFLSCTKMLYVAEKLLRNSYYEVPDPESFAKQLGMTEKEIEDIFDQFEHGGLFRWGDIPTEIEDKYGNMTSEMTYDALILEKKKVEEYIEYLKKRYRLKQKPVISREVLSSISKQIEGIFAEGKIATILASFPQLSHSVWQLGKVYSLTDFLFRHSYADAWTDEIYPIIAEFLNPIYYDIKNKTSAMSLSEYINEILGKNLNKREYKKWLNSASKYAPPHQNEKNKKIHYNPETRTLRFLGQEIVISQRAESDASELLRTIFKNKNKIWNSDEVLDEWRVSVDSSRVPKQKVYQAGKAVNRVIAQETKIKDFLDISIKTVAINKKYLDGKSL